MSENYSTKSSPIINAPKHNVEDEPEVHVLTQKEVNQQIRNYIAPLTKQLENLSGFTQGMTTDQHPTSHPRAATSASFSVPGYQPDMLKRVISKYRVLCQAMIFGLPKAIFASLPG